MDIDVKKLHPLEVRLLRHVCPGEPITSDRIIAELGYNVGQCNQAFSWLGAKGYVAEMSRKTRILFELTELGREQQKTGTPSRRIFTYLGEHGAATLPEIAEALGLEKSTVGSAFGALSKARVAKMNEQKQALLVSDKLPEEEQMLADLLGKGLANPIDKEDLQPVQQKLLDRNSKKRGIGSVPFRMTEKEEIVYELTKEGAAAKEAVLAAHLSGEELGAVTQDILSSGSWKEASFRPYGLNAPTSRLIPGRHNPYGAYLQWVKDKLISLGFEEFDGPLVENEFWNGDALFMPQFHSARDIHDVYYIKEPRHCKEIEEPWLTNVAQTHMNGGNTGSRGWGYAFDHEFTRRQVMRSQGTVLSAHQLTKAKVPGKYFGIVRCFRYDQVDATHGADFYQTEGIVLGKDVNLKTLLGLLKLFAEEIAGAEEVKYVPGYFPFTEPSIEVHIKHPVLGWFELGGSGIFRPEVTKPLGIDVPVLAWGLGIDRMALMHLGLNDLRELFTPDIESVRNRRGN
ncbi:MAG: phenylalanine--tRNA ligase subunit alpha [Spirochaetia bacterium]|jgi:phenylalanyl-tRNA synthetase alpha chain|nr:phenylalanine--tRNA ligase subunit alpha [Spirochaetia bacterium]